ncbi:MAG: site-specific integrase [Bacteroidales bacterium]|nr:site-specific integrase [Bacteroidales bacterium]
MNITLRLRNVGTGLGFLWHKGVKKDNNRENKRFADIYREEIERRKGLVSESTIENELTAYRSFLAFAGYGFTISTLTSEHIIRYERWLRDKGVCPNTSACYMRSLRAVANRLGLDGKALFAQVRTARDKAEKKAVDIGTIRKLKATRLPEDTFQTLARDAFLFSIMAMGMPFIDLAHLRKSDVRDGVIVYNRRKTGRRITVRMEPCMEDILSRYDSASPYLFPLLTETEPPKTEAEYRRLIGRYNRALRRISLKCGLEKKLTSYSARHTWATLAYKQGMGLASISKALGHASPVTTQNYLKEIDDMGLSEANKRLIEEIFG